MKNNMLIYYLSTLLCLGMIGCAVIRGPEWEARRAEKVASQAKEREAMKRVFNLSSADEKEKYDCKFVSLESAGSGMGFTTAGDMAKAVNKTKIVAVRKGGNATRLLMSSSNWDASSITFEVLKCNKSPFDE